MKEMTAYHIPSNFSDAGRVLGMFDLRNLLEMLVLAAPTLGVCVLFARLTDFSMTVNLMVSMVLLVPICGFALMGLRDESLFRFITAYFRWRRGRRLLTYRGDCKRWN